MTAESNKQVAIDGYAAFSALDADAAMKDLSDSVEWIANGDSAVSGTYKGKDEVGGFWMKLLEKGFTTTPKEFIAEGDKVVVLCDVSVAGETTSSVDVLDFDADGKLARFETFGGEELINRAFPR